MSPDVLLLLAFALIGLLVSLWITYRLLRWGYRELHRRIFVSKYGRRLEEILDELVDDQEQAQREFIEKLLSR